MKKYKLFIFAIATMALLGGCSSSVDDQLIKITTAEATQKQIDSLIDIAGVLTPVSSDNISVKISGIVHEINADVGDEVHAGDKLVVLDTKELNAQLEQSKAAYNSAVNQAAVAKSNLDAAKVASTTAKDTLTTTKSAVNDQIVLAKSNLDAAKKTMETTQKQNESQLNQAKINLDNAKISYDRISQVYNAELISNADMDLAKKALDIAQSQYDLAVSAADSAIIAAQAKLDSAQIAYDQAKGSSSESQIVAAQGRVASAISSTETAQKQYEASSTSGIEQAQAAMNSINVQISNATATAPSNGVVISKNINEGELAQAGAPLLTIADTSSLILKGTISQEAIPYVKVGQDVDVIVDIYPDQVLKATVKSVGPMSIATGSYFPVEISLDNANKTLLAGVSAHATINTAKDNAIVIPSSSIIENNGQTYVYAIENGIAIKKEVVIGLNNNTEVEILRGLNLGEIIATSNVNSLFENMPVQIENN